MAATAGQGRPVAVDENVPMEARGGTVLRADVYRPSGGGRCPVLLCCTTGSIRRG